MIQLDEQHWFNWMSNTDSTEWATLIQLDEQTLFNWFKWMSNTDSPEWATLIQLNEQH